MAAPWLPMAGKRNGWNPRDFPEIHAARTIVATLAIPRLPTPMAMRAPGFSAEPNPKQPTHARRYPGYRSAGDRGNAGERSAGEENPYLRWYRTGFAKCAFPFPHLLLFLDN